MKGKHRASRVSSRGPMLEQYDSRGNYIPIDQRPFDPERGFLEQIEEAAQEDDRAYDWLVQNIYQRPDRLSVLTGIRLPPSTNTNGSAQTSPSAASSAAPRPAGDSSLPTGPELGKPAKS